MAKISTNTANVPNSLLFNCSFPFLCRLLLFFRHQFVMVNLNHTDFLMLVTPINYMHAIHSYHRSKDIYLTKLLTLPFRKRGLSYRFMFVILPGLERPAFPRRICAVTRGFQTATQDLSVFPFLPRHYHMTRVLLSPFSTTSGHMWSSQ